MYKAAGYAFLPQDLQSHVLNGSLCSQNLKKCNFSFRVLCGQSVQSRVIEWVRDKKEKELRLRNEAKAVGCTYRVRNLNP